MDGVDVKSASSLSAWVVKAQAELQLAKERGETVKTVATLVPQLQQQIDELHTKVKEARAYQAPERGDTQAMAAYHNPAMNRDELPAGSIATKSHGIGENRPFGVSAEAGVFRFFGAEDEAGIYRPGFFDDKIPKSAHQFEAQQLVEALAWARWARSEKQVARCWRALDRHMRRGPPALAKVWADNATEGGEFIVTTPLATLERTMELERRLEAAFGTMDIASSTATHPFLTTGVQFFSHGVPSLGDMNPGELQKTVPVTAERTITTSTFTGALPGDLDAIDDSIVEWIPMANDLLARARVDMFEDAMINSDNAAVHGDTAFATWNPRSRWQVLGSSQDHRATILGFRQRAFDVDATVTTAATDFSTSQTVASYMSAPVGMSGAQAFGDLIYLTSPEHFLAKILIDTNLLTVDKYGPQATIQVGEVGRIGRHPLLLSEFMTSDLAATGLYTGAGALTSMLIVNRGRYRVVRRRGMSIVLERSALRHTAWAIASLRMGLHSFDSTTTANLRYLYNLSSS